jgi:GTP 3',8-cyclase
MKNYNLDGHKLYWHLDKVQAWQSGKSIAPIYVEISPVSYCNHNCIFCGLDFAQDSPKSLDTDTITRRIIEMGELGVKSIMFAGEGEPLLHKGLPAWVKCAKDNGIDVSITTNGGPGTKELWSQLIPYLSWLRFSVDAGSPSIYAKVHSVSDSAFARTVQNIKDSLSIKDQLGSSCTIGVQYLMIRDNLADVETAIQLFSELGVDYFSLKPYSEHPQMLNKSGFNYSEDDICRIQEIVSSYQSRGSKTRIVFRKAATDNYSEGGKKFCHCQALPFWGYISSSGDFHTCSVFLNDKRFNVGNIYDEEMKSIFSGSRRNASIAFGASDLEVGYECRVNCRMARANEFLEFLHDRPEHINFI